MLGSVARLQARPGRWHQRHLNPRRHAVGFDRASQVGPAQSETGSRNGASTSGSSSSYPVTDWRQKQKTRVIGEIAEAARRAGLKHTVDDVRRGMDALESLLPGFTPNTDAMRAAQWVPLVADPAAVALKLVTLKAMYPRLDLTRVLAKQPKMLLKSPAELEKDGKQVLKLLAGARDATAILQAEPSLLDPQSLVRVLVTFSKWYHLKKDPVEALEEDPSLVLRAQDYDVPFEPAYLDEDGNWTAPLLQYREKRTEWQAYIDQTVYKQP